MVHYKLTYFNNKGMAETARQVFVLAGVEFEDKRITMEEWPEFKDKTPFGHVPILEVDGVVIPESIAITRFLANRYGFAGKTDIEKAFVDAAVDLIRDFFNQYRPVYGPLMTGTKEEGEKAVKEILLPASDKYFKIVQKMLRDNGKGFLVGDSVTFADLLWAEHVAYFGEKVPGYGSDYPEVLEHSKRIRSIPALKKWIETRPITPA